MAVLYVQVVVVVACRAVTCYLYFFGFASFSWMDTSKLMLHVSPRESRLAASLCPE